MLFGCDKSRRHAPSEVASCCGDFGLVLWDGSGGVEVLLVGCEGWIGQEEEPDLMRNCVRL